MTMSAEDKGPATPSTNHNNNNNTTKVVQHSRMLHPSETGDPYSHHLESGPKWECFPSEMSPNLLTRWEDGGPLFAPLVKVAI